MCKILSRIKEFIDYKGIPIATFERSIGMSNASFGKQLKKQGAIGTDKLENILSIYPDLSPLWLMTGEGEMIVTNPDVGNDHIKRPMSGIDPELVKTDPAKGINYTGPFAPTMDPLDSSNDHSKDPDDSVSYPLISEKHVVDPYKPFERLIHPPTEPEGIPLVSVKAVGGFAGSDFSIQKQDIEAYYVIPKFRNRNVDFLIEVSGDSMMPRIFPGDIIACSIIRTPQFIQWNKTYLISSEEQGMIVKRLKKSHDKDSYLAVSDNPEYDPFDIPKRDIMGLALVVGLIHID